jgi:hypothetical protein
LNNNYSITKSHVWQLAFFTILHIFIFSTLYQTVYTIPYSANGLFFDFASEVFNGQLPYRDFVLEYPPFSLFFFILPRLFTANYLMYAVIYQTEVVIAVIVGLFVFYDISRRLGQAPWKLMTVYTLGVLAIGPITSNQFDFFPAVLVLLAIYFYWLDKHPAAWAFLAVGAMTKIFPAMIAPVFLIYYIRNRQYHLIGKGILVFALVSLAIFLPFLILSPTSLGSLYEYHAQRGIQIETTYSSALMLAHLLGWITVRTDFSFGAWNIDIGAENVITGLSTFLLVLFLLVAYWYIYIRSRPGKVDIICLGAYSLLVVLVVIITSKILSPQYLIWLIPLLPLATGKWRYTVWAIFIIAGGLTYLIFPYWYQKLVHFEVQAVLVLALRNFLLILMVILTAISLRATGSESAKARQPLLRALLKR